MKHRFGLLKWRQQVNIAQQKQQKLVYEVCVCLSRCPLASLRPMTEETLEKVENSSSSYRFYVKDFLSQIIAIFREPFYFIFFLLFFVFFSASRFFFLHFHGRSQWPKWCQCALSRHRTNQLAYALAYIFNDLFAEKLISFHLMSSFSLRWCNRIVSLYHWTVHRSFRNGKSNILPRWRRAYTSKFRTNLINLDMANRGCASHFWNRSVYFLFSAHVGSSSMHNFCVISASESGGMVKMWGIYCISWYDLVILLLVLFVQINNFMLKYWM